MDDRISMLPDAVLCHILSFLPTKVSVSTCVLSKRWQLLWRSVPAFNFNYCRDNEHIRRIQGNFNYNFVHWINAFLCSRDPLQSLQKFFLTHVPDNFYYKTDYPTNIYTLVCDAAVQHKLEHIELFFKCAVDIPSVILRCKTLVVLKLFNLDLNHFSSVDLPSLKVMWLHDASIAEHRLLADFLSGCPNLEDMEVCGSLTHIESNATEASFKKLSKLIRAVIIKDLLPLEIVSNVHFLCIEQIDREEAGLEIIEELIPQFHNLTTVEFRYDCDKSNWMDVFKVLNHCPKLEHLVINQISDENGHRWNWQCPPHVPRCFSSHLKTCCIRNYTGYEAEFKFARYIMQTARVLQNMIICTLRQKKHEFKKRLSLCKRLSSTCELSFKEENDAESW